MKFMLLVLSLFSLSASAVLIPPNAVPSAGKTQYVKHINALDDRMDILEAAGTAASYAADGIGYQRVARASFSFADGDLAVGAHGLGVSLPAKAIITRSYIRVDTQLADTGTCTLAISCEDANNIKTATDITGSASGAMVEGQSTGAASAFVQSIGAACEITATVADGGSCVPSAGAGTVFVEYMVSN